MIVWALQTLALIAVWEILRQYILVPFIEGWQDKRAGIRFEESRKRAERRADYVNSMRDRSES